MEIRSLTERDAQTLWDLRMRALQTNLWSFVDSPEELRSISAEEFASKLRANGPENSGIAAFEQQTAVGMVVFIGRYRSSAVTKVGSGEYLSRPKREAAELPER